MRAQEVDLEELKIGKYQHYKGNFMKLLELLLIVKLWIK